MLKQVQHDNSQVQGDNSQVQQDSKKFYCNMTKLFKQHRQIILYLLILTLLCLPFWTWSLWRDEAFSVNLAMNSVSRIIGVVAHDTQPPLHVLLLHYWGKLVGYGAFQMRIISFVSMLASIVVINNYSKYF